MFEMSLFVNLNGDYYFISFSLIIKTTKVKFDFKINMKYIS